MTPFLNVPPPLRFLRRFDPPAATSQELLKVATSAAKDIFYKNGEIVSGTFMFHNPPGEFTSTCEFGWRSTSEKLKVAYTVRKMLEMVGAERYAVISEVWYYSTSAKDRTMADIQRNDPAPSQHPDRKEGVMVLVRDRTDTPLSSFFDIKRRINAKPMLVDHLDHSKVSELVDMTFGKLYQDLSS